MRRPVSVRVLRSGHLPEPLARQLLALTRRCDGDFVPLCPGATGSVRSSATSALRPGRTSRSYVDSLLELAHLVVLVQDERLVGYCAYYWPWMWRGTEHVYVSTAVVAPSHRGRGLSTRTGRRVVARALRRRVPLLAKTWSTNQASMGALARWGRVDKIVRDERGAGIDTVYWRLDTSGPLAALGVILANARTA
ncbi:GNAT family N-acetyltransferase [Actinomyces gerencseriae]|uniref:GNAT family N-acetyltransferase n=1 Tax=Actinomyces gerencseriae TaxID=52769 RepID=UPI00040935BC|nr:GNAT family N-acetyltransferase [Actinomyces gerencseriae]